MNKFMNKLWLKVMRMIFLNIAKAMLNHLRDTFLNHLENSCRWPRMDLVMSAFYFILFYFMISLGILLIHVLIIIKIMFLLFFINSMGNIEIFCFGQLKSAQHFFFLCEIIYIYDFFLLFELKIEKSLLIKEKVKMIQNGQTQTNQIWKNRIQRKVSYERLLFKEKNGDSTNYELCDNHEKENSQMLNQLIENKHYFNIEFIFNLKFYELIVKKILMNLRLYKICFEVLKGLFKEYFTFFFPVFFLTKMK